MDSNPQDTNIETPSVEQILANGQQAMAQGNLDEAIKNFSRVIQLSPELPLGHFSLGIALLSANRIDEAVSNLRQAVNLHPRQPSIHHQLGIALYLQKNYEASVKSLHAALQLNPVDTDVLFTLTEVFHQAQLYADALVCVNRILKLAADNPDAIRIKELLLQKLNLLPPDGRKPQYNIIKKPQPVVPHKVIPMDMINVEITTYCNLQCPGCFRTVTNNNSTWQNSHMSLDTFRQIVDSLPPANLFMPYGIGEPTLHPHLPEIIRFAYEAKKFRVISITTNALVRDLDYYQNLFATGLSRVMVSVDSLDPVLVQRLRRGTDTQKLKTRIQQFVTHFPGRVDISTVVGRENIHAIPVLLQELNQLGQLNVMLQPYDDVGNDSGCLSLAERNWFVHHTRKIAASFPNLKITVNHFTPSFNLCSWPWKGPYVTADGYVTPCCRIPDPDICNFGNISTNSFNEVWYAHETELWRGQFLKESPPMCEGCPMFVERKNATK